MIRPPTAAVVDSNNKVRSLIVPKEPDRELAKDDLANQDTLARTIMRLLRDVATLDRRPCPRRIDFEDIVVNGDGVTAYVFPHGFGGRVRWWVTDCVTSNGGLTRSTPTTDNVLALISTTAGTVTVRIEEVGG